MNSELSKQKVVLGLSGGVDSAAAAILLKKQGYEVIALYFDVITEDNDSKRKKAENTADKLGIKFVYKNLSEEFNKQIIEPFVCEYLNGRTPSPCVMCNPLIKWKILADTANAEGAYYVASGHYAKIKNEDGLYYVQKSDNDRKDQSYMLSGLGQEILARVIFPLSEIVSKDETRTLVLDQGIEIPASEESQDICFIKDNYVNFINNYLSDRDLCHIDSSLIERAKRCGAFVDADGNILGKCAEGVYAYTIGQRKGLGIALGKPAFVSNIDLESANITLTTNEADIMKRDVKVKNLKWVGNIRPSFAKVKLRYAASPANCEIEESGGGFANLYFELPQRAPTPGQFAVIYYDNLVVGNAIIC